MAAGGRKKENKTMNEAELKRTVCLSIKLLREKLGKIEEVFANMRLLIRSKGHTGIVCLCAYSLFIVYTQKVYKTLLKRNTIYSKIISRR